MWYETLISYNPPFEIFTILYNDLIQSIFSLPYKWNLIPSFDMGPVGINQGRLENGKRKRLGLYASQLFYE